MGYSLRNLAALTVEGRLEEMFHPLAASMPSPMTAERYFIPTDLVLFDAVTHRGREY